jgi:hypothetical protein
MGGVQRKTLGIAAIFVGGMIAGIVSLILFQNRPQTEPDTATLKHTLQAAAQDSIKLPDLAESNLQISIEKSKLDQEVSRIKKLAAKLGGAAVQGALAPDGTEILAEIPPQARARFIEAIRDPGEEAKIGMELDGSGSVLVNVTLKFIHANEVEPR